MKKAVLILMISLFCLSALFSACDETSSYVPSDSESASSEQPSNNTTQTESELTEPESEEESQTEPETQPHEHAFGEWVQVVAPTCTESGTQERICACGQSEQSDIAATGHSAELDVAIAPTCTETGLTEGTHCAVCNEILVQQETLPALGHTEQIDAAVQPTCMDKGLTEGKHCAVCDTVLVAQEPIPETGHSFGDWYETTAPTETEKGERRRDCANCDTFETSPIAELTHSHDRWDLIILPAVAPTCTETGLTQGQKCSGCGEILTAQEPISALGHSNVIDAATLPTCTQTGLTEGKHCSVCHQTIVAQEVIPALGHSEAIDTAIAPTCTETGLTEGMHCSTCSSIIVAQELIPATGHIEVVDAAIAPTCTETGLTEGMHCSTCSSIIVAQELIPATGHTEVVDAAIAPTCTEAGLTEGKHCDVCHQVLLEQQTDPATGHTEVIDAAIAPTCTTNGYTEGLHCAACGETLVTQNVIYSTHVYEGDNCTLCGCTHEKYFIFSEYRHGYSLTIARSASVPNELIFPSHYKGLPVLRIANVSHDNVERVVIPDTITTLDERAFYDSAALRSVEISENSAMTSWGDYVFENCTQLTEIRIPDGLTRIPEYAFAHCTSLTTVQFSNAGNLTSIGNRAFSNCYALERLDIPEGVTHVYYAALSGKHLTIPSTLTSFLQKYDGEYAGGPYESITVHPDNPIFHSSGNCLIETATNTLLIGSSNSIIPDYVTVIGRGAFRSSPIREITIPDSVIEIRDSAFSHSSLQRVVMGSGVKTIGNEAFSYCFELAEASLSPNLETIGNSAFEDCFGLNMLIIPQSVTSIGQRVFFRCDITSLCYEISAPLQDWGDNWAKTKLDGTPDTQGIVFGFKRLLRINDLEVILYEDKAAVFRYVGTDATLVIPDTVEGAPIAQIMPRAFYQNTSIVSVSIPNSVHSICTEAFKDCENLTTAPLPASLQYIGESAFSMCWCYSGDGNHTLIIPPMVTYVGEFAFNYGSLNRIIIPESVTHAGQYAFAAYATVYCAAPEKPQGWHNMALGGNDEIYWNFDRFATHDGFDAIIWRDHTADIIAYRGEDEILVVPFTIDGAEVTGLRYNALGSGRYHTLILPDTITFAQDYSVNRSGLLILCYATEQPSGWSEKWSDAQHQQDNYNYLIWGLEQIVTVEDYDYALLTEGRAMILAYRGTAQEELTFSVPEGYRLFGIGSYAFAGQTSWTSCHIPDGVEVIGGCAFDHGEPYDQASCYLPDSVKYIGGYAFDCLVYCTLPQAPSMWSPDWQKYPESIGPLGITSRIFWSYQPS